MTTLAELQQNGPRLIGKDIYAYAFVFPVSELTASAQVTKSINIENDSQFLWTKATYFAFVDNSVSYDASTRTIPLVTVQWRDTSSSNQIFNVPIYVENFFGTGEIPFILPEPKLLEPRTTVSVDATNQHSADAYSLYLCMIGMKLYR